jgi:hypothetical protein
MVGTDENTARREGRNVIGREACRGWRSAVGGEAKKTDTIGMVWVASSVKKTNPGTGTGEGTIREEEGSITGRTCHGPVVGMGKDRARSWVIRLREPTKKEAFGISSRNVRRKTERERFTTNRFEERERRDGNLTRLKVSVRETELEVVGRTWERTTQSIELVTIGRRILLVSRRGYVCMMGWLIHVYSRIGGQTGENAANGPST